MTRKTQTMLTLSQVLERIPLSRHTLLRYRNAGKFPQPIGRLYRKAEIEAYEQGEWSPPDEGKNPRGPRSLKKAS